MRRVANVLLNLCLFKDERVFFFPRLTYNLVFLFRLSYSLRSSPQCLIGERCRGNFFVSFLLLRQRVKIKVKVKVKLYCRKVLRW